MDQRQVKEPKPKRPRKGVISEAKRQVDIAEQSDLWGMVLNTSFWITAKVKRAPHWELSEDDLTETSDLVSEAVNRNIPEGWLATFNKRLKQGAPAMASIAAIGALIAERLATDRAIAAQKKTGGAGAGAGVRRADYPAGPDPSVFGEEAD